MRKCFYFLVAAFIIACFCNIYLITLLWKDSQDSRKLPDNVSTKQIVKRIEKLRLKTRNLAEKVADTSSEIDEIVNNIKNQFSKKKLQHNIDEALSKWIKPDELVPEFARELGSVVHQLKTSRVKLAEISRKGTQLKVLLTLENNVKALFKPQWYSRSTVIDGSVYSGKDRHNAEIVAFFLSLLLGLRRTPVAVGRKFQLAEEIWKKAEPNLAATFYRDDMNNTCFYGVCYYCKKDDPVCGSGDSIEGAVILWLPVSTKLKKYRSPWQRTYRDNVPASWELDDSYCQKVANQSSVYNLSSGNRRLLDLVETSVFDFLMSNGDRHHYEVIDGSREAAVLLIDNGKSFGRPDIDYLDILAPLYQCCVIRESFLERLRLFRYGRLSRALNELTQLDLLYPLLTSDHLRALDRRLSIVLEAVNLCHEVSTSGITLY